MNSWVVLLVAVFVLSVGATPLSQQLCGTRGRSTGISGGLCQTVLESLNGELPSCPSDDATMENALAIFDFFSDDQLMEQVPAAAKILDRVVECAEVGTFWNANLSLYTLPGWTGPCQDGGFQANLPGQAPFLNFRPCALSNLFPANSGAQYCDAASDNYQWWTSYITFYGAQREFGQGYGATVSDFNLAYNPNCLDPQLASDADTFNLIAAYGGRPYCSFFSDLSSGYPTCGELARFRPVGIAGPFTGARALPEQEDLDFDDFSTAKALKTHNSVYQFNGYWQWEYCSKPLTVLNPWVPNQYELVTCYEWSTCDNEVFNNGTNGYQDWLYNGTFPVCNPCNCQGQGSPGSTHKRDGSSLGQRDACSGVGSPGSTHTAGSPGSTHTAGSPGSTHTAGGAFGSDCGGQGSPGSTHTTGSTSPGRQVSQSRKDTSTAAELFELLAQLHVESALQAEQPWQEILGRMCSCACGPAF